MSDKAVEEYSMQFGKFILNLVSELSREYRDRVDLMSGKVTCRRLVDEYISEQMLYIKDIETGETSAALKVIGEIPCEILDAIESSSNPIALTNAIARIV